MHPPKFFDKPFGVVQSIQKNTLMPTFITIDFFIKKRYNFPHSKRSVIWP